MTVEVLLADANISGSCMACSRTAYKIAQIRLTLEGSQSSTLVRLCDECLKELVEGIIRIRYGAG